MAGLVQLDTLQNEGNLVEVVKELRRRVAELELKSVRALTLSDLAGDLGTLHAGAFVAGDSQDPREDGNTFSGVAMLYPPILIDGVLYNIVGMDGGTLQFGLAATDGKVYAGGGVVVMDETGIYIVVTSVLANNRSYKFKTASGDVISALRANLTDAPAKNYIQLSADKVPGGVGYDSTLTVISDAHLGKYSQVILQAKNNGDVTGAPTLTLSNDGTSKTMTADVDIFEVNGGIDASQDISASRFSGWNVINHTLTYASASTFTVNGDLTALYTKGLKLRWVQTTTKYGSVLSSSYSSGTGKTTVTIAVNTDFTIANAAITSPYFSRVRNPVGWPIWFSFTPSLSNVTVGNGTLVGKYSIEGNLCDFFFAFVLGSTSAITSPALATPSLTPPITPASYPQDYYPIGPAGLVDTGMALYMGELVFRTTTGLFDLRVIGASGSYAVWTFVNSATPHTWGTGDKITATGRYFI